MVRHNHITQVDASLDNASPESELGNVLLNSCTILALGVPRSPLKIIDTGGLSGKHHIQEARSGIKSASSTVQLNLQHAHLLIIQGNKSSEELFNPILSICFPTPKASLLPLPFWHWPSTVLRPSSPPHYLPHPPHTSYGYPG